MAQVKPEDLASKLDAGTLYVVEVDGRAKSPQRGSALATSLGSWATTVRAGTVARIVDEGGKEVATVKATGPATPEPRAAAPLVSAEAKVVNPPKRTAAPRKKSTAKKSTARKRTSS